MLRKKYSIWRLALRNINKQRFQSIILFVLLLITTVTFFFGDYLTQSMREGLEKTKERLGADLIVVPDRFISSLEDALFLGKPCTVNFNKEWLDKIADTEGVEKVSYQLYIASLGMDCCDSSLQLIAVDMESDFTVAPWLSKNGINKLAKDEIILGSNMEKKIGDEVKYFGRNFKVIDILQETGMGYDNCAFINYEAAYEISNDPNYDSILPFHKNEKVISMVLVKLKEGRSISETKENILNSYGNEGIAVYSTSDLVSRFADNLSNFKVYGTIFMTLFFILAVVALYGSNRITVHLRKSEFGTYFSFGTRKRTILFMLYAEMLLLVISATILGIGLVCLFILPFHEALKELFAIPYRMPSTAHIIKIGFRTLVINIIICILAAAKSFYELARLEGIQLIKSNNE